MIIKMWLNTKKPQINRKSENACLQLIENLRNPNFSGTPGKRVFP